MYGTLAYTQLKTEENKNARRVPLMCWDLAHPGLPKQVRIAEDLQALRGLEQKYRWKTDLNFRELLAENNTLVITDLMRNIQWVSTNFFDLTGYLPQEVIGQKPTMLQGEKTTAQSRAKIRECLAELQRVIVNLVNYRKNGEIYHCNIEILPLYNTDGVATHFIAIEKERL
ncbi:MAG: PAS domain-containing protein [Runella sp.]